MITKKAYLEAKERIAKYEQELEELKSLLSRGTISIKISGFLSNRNNIIYYAVAKKPVLNFKGRMREFTTVSDLKKFYGIKKANKTDEKGWAINPKGNRIEWDVYEAEIPMSFLLDSEWYNVEDFTDTGKATYTETLPDGRVIDIND